MVHLRDCILPDPAVVELFLNHLVDPLHYPFEQTKQIHNYDLFFSKSQGASQSNLFLLSGLSANA